MKKSVIIITVVFTTYLFMWLKLINLYLTGTEGKNNQQILVPTWTAIYFKHQQQLDQSEYFLALLSLGSKQKVQIQYSNRDSLSLGFSAWKLVEITYNKNTN